ncbi:hypothetical protein VM636_14600 [Streptomyces sp. SCSIO 75703]|uniref:hypothetical protein n=1 Tax=Streptomyces sp. SCSIO 75703 TaxID=3112165 RepID=UPI0030CC9F20
MAWWPVRRGGAVGRRGALERRGGGPPAERHVAGPLYEAGRLGFVDRPGREYWWDRLGEGVRERMEARVGPVVDWWAYCHRGGERPYAVVLGERGLAECTPTVNDRGGPAQLLTVVPFVPASLRHAVVVRKASRAPFGGKDGKDGKGGPGGGEGGPGGGTVPLSARMRGFMGHLPEEAQARLQWPFLDGDVLDRGDFHYRGDEHALDVWCYLAGRRWVTFVSGHGTGLSGPAHRASWRLVCRRAEVAVR